MDELINFFKIYPEAMLLVIVLAAFAVAVLGILFDALVWSKGIKEFEDIQAKREQIK